MKVGQKTCLLLITIVLVNSTGCQLVDPGMAWSPDSKTLFYVTDNNTVMQYDVENRAARVLEKGSKAPTSVSISPNGQFAATTASAWGPKSSAVAIAIYDLRENRPIASESGAWGDEGAPREFRKSASYWCPSNKRVLVCYESGKFGTDTEAVVYGVGERKFSRVKTTQPAASFCAIIGISPIRPDGKGYLAMRENKDEPDFSFVDWDGWEHKLELAREARDTLSELEAQSKRLGSDGNKLVESAMLPFPRGRWEDNTIVLPCYDGVVRIDTEQRIIEYKEQEELAGTRKSLAKNGVFFREEFADGRFAIQIRRVDENAMIELVESARNRQRTLVQSLDSSPIDAFPLRSADGNYMAVRSRSDGQSKVLIIGADGELAATIDVGGK